MPKKNKFRKGEKITLLYDLVGLLMSNEWVYMYDRPKHPRVLMNMSLCVLQGGTRRGAFCRAVLNEEE